LIGAVVMVVATEWFGIRITWVFGFAVHLSDIIALAVFGVITVVGWWRAILNAIWQLGGGLIHYEAKFNICLMSVDGSVLIIDS
jgi:hypothetical protein